MSAGTHMPPRTYAKLSGSVGEPRLPGRLGVRCPKCGAAPGFRCLVLKAGPGGGAVTTKVRGSLHHERKAGRAA